jgi:hypothetical protein
MLSVFAEEANTGLNGYIIAIADKDSEIEESAEAECGISVGL